MRVCRKSKIESRVNLCVNPSGERHFEVRRETQHVKERPRAADEPLMTDRVDCYCKIAFGICRGSEKALGGVCTTVPCRATGSTVYLLRYAHCVAISERRLISCDEAGVTFRYKDNRRDGAECQKVMALPTDEFICRLLIHALPRCFHRIRHYGLLASSTHKDAMALARRLLGVAAPIEEPEAKEPLDHFPPCPCCDWHMTIIETFTRRCQPPAPPEPAFPARRHVP